jgi:hypothetical protein
MGPAKQRAERQDFTLSKDCKKKRDDPLQVIAEA